MLWKAHDSMGSMEMLLAVNRRHFSKEQPGFIRLRYSMGVIAVKSWKGSKK